jgi:uncharacterized protein YwgA
MILKERTLEEKTIDKLLLLYILNKTTIRGKTKLQKTVFFIEDSLNSEGIKAFNYKFIRWHYGEFSRELESDLKELVENNLIVDSRGLTDRSIDMLKKIESSITKNSKIARKIDAISKWASERPLDIVRTLAYTKILRDGIQVKDIPEDTVLLQKLDESQTREKFIINGGWIGTLELLFNKNAADSLNIALKQRPDIPFRA